MSRPGNIDTGPFDFPEDRISGCGPDKGFRFRVVSTHEAVDFGHPVPGAPETASSEGLLGDQVEPNLDLIEPGGVGRRIVDVIMEPGGQPSFNLGMFVRGIVVDDQMEIQILRDVLVDVVEKLEKLLMPVSGLAHGGYLTRNHVQCGKQGRGSLAQVIVRDPFDVAHAQGQ